MQYLKLQPHYRTRTCGSCIVPELRLNGRWLEKAGFIPDDYVCVTVMEGLVIIRSDKYE